MGRDKTKVGVPVTGAWEQVEIHLLRCCSDELSVQEVAEQLGRSLSATQSKVTELGIKYQKTGEQHHRTNYADWQVEDAIILYLTGTSQQEVADLLGIPRNTISSWCLGHVRNYDLDWERIEEEIGYD